MRGRYTCLLFLMPSFQRPSKTGSLFSRSNCCIPTRLFHERHVSPGHLSGLKTRLERLWREFFSDPSEWWDHRSEKVNPRYPDFKHKKTQQALWLIDNLNPSWVESELAVMAPDLVQAHIFSWHVRLRRHVKAGDYKKTLNLFKQMKREGIVLDKFTFVAVLNACSNLRSLEEGRRVHEQIVESGCASEIYVGNCLVDMYAKCGSIEDAWSVFNNMRERNVVSWSAMIAGYVKCEQGMKAVKLFREMLQEGVEPNVVTFVGVLNACASVAALEEGRRVHDQIIQRGCQSNVYVANCLVDMYGKCGSIHDARSIFNRMQERNVGSWNAMIGCYSIHGHSNEAIELFKRMGKEGIEIDDITFTCLLSACSHGGLVREGLRYFNSMISSFKLLPTIEHYACMVNLLGRAGRLEDAEEITMGMPMEGDTAVWMSLLGACRIHGNIEMAERVARRCWVLDPEDASGHVLLSNIYAAGRKRDRSANIGRGRLQNELCKEPGLEKTIS